MWPGSPGFSSRQGQKKAVAERLGSLGGLARLRSVARRRSVRRRFRRLKAGLKRPAVPLICLVCGVILAINGAVRTLGGDVRWWSVERLEERAGALSLLVEHRLRAIWQPAGLEPEAALRAAARKHGVSPRLLLEVARAESDFVTTRISGTGAMGMMQLMPDTAEELGVIDPFDSEQSADGGALYLKRLLKAYRGDVRRALAAYNAGPSRIPSSGPIQMPAETRGYVAKITGGL